MGSSLQIRENISLAELTTFRVGGAARLFLTAGSEAEIVGALEFADEEDIDLFVLGGGSNVLISDEGFNGLVLNIAIKGISYTPLDGDEVIVTAGAGEDWDELVDECVRRDLAGIECLSGIPGLVGGTPIQNVGAYGQEVSETIVSVRVLDRKDRSVKKLGNRDCRFEYRKSIFNTDRRDRYIVLEVVYRLKRGGKPKIEYRDLKERFAGRQPTIMETRKAVCEIRKAKGMLVRQGGPDSQSAGSFFKNPVVGQSDFEFIRRFAVEKGLGEVPHFQAGNGRLKVPAAWLIEKIGFEKGYTVGAAGLSTKHTLAITNRGGASAKEIISLKDLIASKIKETLGIELVIEPNLIGFD